MLCMNVLAPKLMLQMSYIPDQHQPPQWTKSEQVCGPLRMSNALAVVHHCS